jgi:hypothetical protein
MRRVVYSKETKDDGNVVQKFEMQTGLRALVAS